MARTYSNSMETVFTIIAFYYWPWSNIPRSNSQNDKVDSPLLPWITARQYALFIAALAVVMRPTSALTWVFLAVNHMISLRLNGKLKFVFSEALPIG
jgi:phosphatidylinositol glycan class B